LLESSYGSSGLASAPNYNLFGVKGSYNGQSVYMPVQMLTQNYHNYFLATLEQS
jgi:flagellum-specific peptidoglycan hydrolase FlgJ